MMGGPVAAPNGGKSSAGLIIGIVAGVAVIGGVVGFLLLRKPAESGEVIPLPPTATTTTTTTAVSSDPASSGAPVSSGGPAETPSGTPIKPPPTTSGTPSTPGTSNAAVDPKKDAACKAAMAHAQPGNLSIAVNDYKNCDGPNRAAAAAKIGSAANTSVSARGCAAIPDARAAAQIGQGGALAKLKADKKCKL